MELDKKTIGGLLIFIAVAQFIIMLIILESVYPGYDVGKNYISDLGVGPTGLAFSGTTILFGFLMITSAYFLMHALKSRMYGMLQAIMGIGAIGVGVFPETLLAPHSAFALIAFVFGAILAIYSGKFQKPPSKYVSIVLGVLSLAILFLSLSKLYTPLGFGGMERMVVYPTLLWGLMFSGYLMKR